MTTSGPAARPKRSARGVFCSAVLTFEIFVIVLAALVAFGLREPGTSVGPIWAVAGGGVLLCLVAAGLVRRPVGLWLGSLLQVLLIAAGLVVPAMYGVGGVFAVLWVVAILLGRRIDTERAERAALEDRLSA
ncbi:DUF4233 domain-containing protein [Pseudactinotalea suaedae]|uniref:DUF4233 domain-containing protein n=1 Tax=Pseudactinotalea suaedae TaxID=1524924 RepID=UPI0012E31C90|nr:DUF4233 domain-containing protein [Pseudactinotalea suaedae]